MSRAPSQTHDKNGRPWAKLSDLKVGDKIEVDNDFTCMTGQQFVRSDGQDLFVVCNEGRHRLCEQADDGEHCVGIYKVELSK